jgi:hypothetical protein
LVPGLGSAQSVKQKAAIEQEIKRLDVAHADAILRGDMNLNVVLEPRALISVSGRITDQFGNA